MLQKHQRMEENTSRIQESRQHVMECSRLANIFRVQQMTESRIQSRNFARSVSPKRGDNTHNVSIGP